MSYTRRNFILAIKTVVLIAAATLLSSTVNAAGPGSTFDKTLTLHGISFHVTCPNASSLNPLTIVPSGLTIDNSIITKEEIDGSVTGAEVADLNGDGFPEIYIYINSAGSGSYGSLVAYGSNKNKSLSEIALPPLEDDTVNSKGYMGHDAFSVMEDNLVRRFPLYNENDSNANPTGGMRQLHYTLVPGEAAWLLKLVKGSST